MHLKKVALFLAVVTIGSYNTVAGQSALGCPAVRTTSGWLDLFPLPCRKNAECLVMGNLHLCCKGFCTKGITISSALRTSLSTRVTIPTSSSSTSMSTTPSTTTSTSTTTTSTTTPSTTTTTTSTTTPSTTTTTTTTTTTPSTTSSTTTTTTTTTTPAPTTTTTTAAPLSFLQLLPIEAPTTAASVPIKTSNSIIADINYSRTRNSDEFYEYNVDYSSAGKTQKYVCPKPGQAPVILFPILCQKNSQCRATSGPDQVCCEGRCVKGVPAPRPTSAPKPHQPLLGVIPRECPSAPLGELLFEVETCKADSDCWPRICCPDGTRSYCRTARARLDLVPVANRIDAPVRMLEQYLQCTPPPEYDLFPQKCNSSIDCFPNLCCAEGGKKHCRPPQRNLLSLLAGVGRSVGSTLANFRQAQANANRS